jgi:hypothetical protein
MSSLAGAIVRNMMSVALKRIIVANFDFDVAKLECIWQVELESLSKKL